jgi:hypothetical protein
MIQEDIEERLAFVIGTGQRIDGVDGGLKK